MRATTLRLLIALALVVSWPLAAEPGPVTIRAAPVLLDPADAAADRVGLLRYRAGFHLTSDSGDFGGFSGLVIAAGGRLTAVSDQGYWLTAELRLSADGTLEGLDAGRMGVLCDDDGGPVAGKERRDAEELVELPGQGLLVSFEHHHRIVLYVDSKNGPPLSGPPRPFPFPPPITTAASNKGMEAVALLADGRLLTFAEDLRTIDGDILGWIGHPERGDWRHLTLAAAGDYLPTGAVTLPSGDVLLLERSYRKETGNRVRLSLLAAAAFAPGVRLAPRELAELAPPLTVDNMEAVAATAGPGGETLIYLLSDDNYNASQRTLLMQFEWLEESPLIPSPPGGEG